MTQEEQFNQLDLNEMTPEEDTRVRKGSKKTGADKGKIMQFGFLVLVALTALGFLVYSVFGKKSTPDESFITKTTEQKDAGTDAFTLAGNPHSEEPPPPPNMVAEVVPPTIDPSIAEREAKEAALSEARIKSNVIVVGDGQMATGASAQGDTSGQPQMPAELQAIFGAMGGAGGAGVDAQGNPVSQSQGMNNRTNKTTSQGGRFDGGSTIAPSARASYISDRQYKIMQGKIIDAVLLTSVKSDLPGQIIAVVSSPVYGEQGRYTLLPSGTRLFGEYSSSVNYGQAEIAAVWRRAITPQGVQINLDSPSTNALGVAGLGGGKVNNHYVQTFGVAAMLSLIGASASTIGANTSDQNNSLSNYRNALQQSFSDSSKNLLQSRGNIPPTITVKNGTTIKVLVAKDLDFQDLVN